MADKKRIHGGEELTDEEETYYDNALIPDLVMETINKLRGPNGMVSRDNVELLMGCMLQVHCEASHQDIQAVADKLIAMIEMRRPKAS